MPKSTIGPSGAIYYSPDNLKHSEYWKDEWPSPRLKNVHFVAREEVENSLISQVEVWQSVRGYYVYHRYHDGNLSLSSGPHRLDSTALKHAKEEKAALEAK